MRVLHVVNWHRGGGGADNACRATIELCRNNGMETDVFERDSGSLSPGLKGKAAAFMGGLYAKEALVALRRRLEHERPDIVHTHEIFPLVSPWAFKLCAEMGIPVVHAVYDFRISCPVATHFDGDGLCTACLSGTAFSAIKRNCRGSLAESTAFAMRHELARRFDLYRRYVTRFVVLTPFTKNWLIEQAGLDEGRIAVNGCAVPVKGRAADPERSDRIGFAGRPVPEKGIDVLLAAAQRLGKSVSICVPESARGMVADLAGLEVTVTSEPAALSAFYRSCRALVVPSLWFETFCLVAVEAQAEGVPVIASRIGALQDTVLDEKTGLHVPPGDDAALAAAIDRILNEDGLASALGGRGRARVMEEFSEDAHFSRLAAIYEDAQRAGPGGVG